MAAGRSSATLRRRDVGVRLPRVRGSRTLDDVSSGTLRAVVSALARLGQPGEQCATLRAILAQRDLELGGPAVGAA